MDSFAFARLRSAAVMFSGDPVITVGKKRVTPVREHGREWNARSVRGWRRRVVIDAGEAIHLQIDPAGRDKHCIVQGMNQMIDDVDGRVEGHFDRRSARNIDAATVSSLTFVWPPVYTQVSHRPRSAKCKTYLSEKSC